MPKLLTYTDFETHKDTEIKGTGPDGNPIVVRLTTIEKLAEYAGQKRIPFSLLFSAPGDRNLNQGTFVLDMAELGEQHIFAVPIGYDDHHRIILEAVFN